MSRAMTAANLAHDLKAKRSGPGWIARCPAHDDHRESLSIGESSATPAARSMRS
jgi:hypothetical protein